MNFDADADENADPGLERLGPVARMLASSEPTSLAGTTDQEFADAVVEIAELHADEYPMRDGDELDLALTRIVMWQIPGVDKAIIEWLADEPTTEGLGVVARMLWQLWSTAVAHPPIEPELVRLLLTLAHAVHIGDTERGPLDAALKLAAQQVEDAEMAELIRGEIHRDL